jgi:hypothetical protein
VLRTSTNDPPTDLLSVVIQTVKNYLTGQAPTGAFAWVWQEKTKGQAAFDDLLGSTHGGWKFNASYDTNGSHLSPVQAANLPVSELQTNAFFDWSSFTFTADLALYGSGGSAYATNNQSRILSDAVPSLTEPVGANPVPALDADSRNFDMQLLYENGWPYDRGTAQYPPNTPAVGEWHHSDFRVVAYTYTYKLFNEFVEIGNLK